MSADLIRRRCLLLLSCGTTRSVHLADRPARPGHQPDASRCAPPPGAWASAPFHRVGANPIVEVVTTGVLLRRLQHDPECRRADVVILDECHERHLDADTALAFLLDVRATLRPDLRLVAASATADTGPWSRLLGGAPVVSAGRPPRIRWRWSGRRRPVPYARRTACPSTRRCSTTSRRPCGGRWPSGTATCCASCPASAEIDRVAALSADSADVLRLHGRAPAAVQDAVLRVRRAGGASCWPPRSPSGA